MKPIALFCLCTLAYSQDTGIVLQKEQTVNSEYSFSSIRREIVSTSATPTSFMLTATPQKLAVVVGTTGTMVVTQINALFSGTVSYKVLNLVGINTEIRMIGNTATILFSVPFDMPLGTKFALLEGSSVNQTQQMPISIVVSDQPKLKAPNITGSLVVSSVVGNRQVVNFTELGTADWFATGDSSCPYTGPCATARKTGGTGLVAAINGGNGDGWFYSFSPGLINLTWNDSVSAPNGKASFVNNTLVQVQAFSGTSKRVMTLVAGLAGGGTLVTNLHMTDGTTPDVTDIQTFPDTGVRVFTIAFNAASIGHQLVVTLSHKGGELLMYGAALSGTLAPQVHFLELTDNIVPFLDAVTSGDTLVLPDGYLYTGHLILPARRDGGWVDIKSNNQLSSGQRVRPGELKATLVSPDELPLIQNDFLNPDHSKRPTHGWRFTGIEMTVNNHKGLLNYGLISFGFGSDPSVSDISRDISFQRCYIHGDGINNYVKGIIGNANNLSIVDSYIAGFVSTFMEANAINIYSSAGPIQIVNNYLEASAENVMIGGSGPDVGPALIPTNGLIQHNYFKKLPAWRGGQFIIKNLLEFKTGFNFAVDSNVFENCWQANQGGAALLFTPRTGQGGTIANHVDTIVLTNNVFSHVGTGISLGLYDDLAKDDAGNSVSPAKLQLVHDIVLRNNLFNDLGLQYSQYSHGILITGPPKNLVIDHNTFVFNEQTNDHGWWLTNDTGVAASNAVVTNNDFGADLYGDGRRGSDAILSGSRFTGNNIEYSLSNWSGSLYSQSNTFSPTAPASSGADISGLLTRAVSVKNGNRPE